MAIANWQDDNAQHEEARQERASWDAHHKELGEYFLPRRGRWAGDQANRGDKRNQKQIDPTPAFAARILQAGLTMGLTNPSQPWFRLGTPDPEMMEMPSVSRWLYSVEARMRDIFERSNVYTALSQVYQEGGVFGTAPFLIVDDPRTVIRCVNFTVGSYSLARDVHGQIDTLFVPRKMTVRNAVNYFGQANVSPQTASLYREKKYQQWVDVLHVVAPNHGRDANNASAANLPWRSTYWETCLTERPVKESGFYDNPIAGLTWDLVPDDVYGSSPAMICLGAAKALQVQQKRKAQAIDKHIDPPMIGDPGIRSQPTTLLPGGVTWAGFTASGSSPKFVPAYQIKPEIGPMLEDIQDLRQTIREAMFYDLFLMFASTDRRQITAEEIAKRYEEKLLMLGPVIQNHKQGLADRLIDVTFNTMAREGLLPEPPPELEGVPLKVELISTLAQAARMVATGSMERFVSFVGAVAKAQADAGEAVTAFDKLNADQTIDEYAMATGVPPTIVRSDDEVAAIREERSQAQQQAQMAAAAAPLKDAAMAAKAASETNVGGESMLDRFVGSAA